MLTKNCNLFLCMLLGVACKATTPSQTPPITQIDTSSEGSPSPDVSIPLEEQQTESKNESSSSLSSAVTQELSVNHVEEKPPLQLPPPLFPKKNPACGKDPGLNTKAIDFSLPTPKGEQLSLRQYPGRIILLNFWGTWCKPCLKELPEFSRLYRHYQKYGLTLIAVATDADGEEVMKFVNQHKLAAKIALQGEALAGKYNSPSFPFSFVLDQKNIIRASYHGYKPECLGQLEHDIRSQLQILYNKG